MEHMYINQQQFLELRNHSFHPEGSHPIASQSKTSDTVVPHAVLVACIADICSLLRSIKAFEEHMVLCCETWSCRSEVRRYAASRHMCCCLLHLPHNASSNLELPACGWFTWRKMRGWTKREGEAPAGGMLRKVFPLLGCLVTNLCALQGNSQNLGSEHFVG